MEQITAFLQQQWIMVAVALLVVVLVIKLVKTVVKWAIVLAIIAGLLFYGANYKDKLADIKDTLGTMVAAEVKDQALKALAGEAKEAKYKLNPDGSFTIQSKSLQVEGKPDTSEVKVTFMGQTFHLKMDEAVKAFVEQAKKNQ